MIHRATGRLALGAFVACLSVGMAQADEISVVGITKSGGGSNIEVQGHIHVETSSSSAQTFSYTLQHWRGGMLLETVAQGNAAVFESSGCNFSPCGGSCTVDTCESDGCHERFGTCGASGSDCNCNAEGTVGKGKLAFAIQHGDSFVFTVTPAAGSFPGDDPSNNSITVVLQ